MAPDSVPPHRPLTLTLVYSGAPRQVCEIELQLPAGSTLAQALEQAQRQWYAAGTAGTPWMACTAWPAAAVAAAEVGLWGRPAPPQTELQQGDRIEIYRPLRVDPKVARRERYRQRGKTSQSWPKPT